MSAKTVPNFFSLSSHWFTVPGLRLGADEDEGLQVLFTPCAQEHQNIDARDTLPTLVNVQANQAELLAELRAPETASSGELRRVCRRLRLWRLQLESGGYMAPWSGERL